MLAPYGVAVFLYYARQARWHHRFVLSALAQEKFCARAVLFSTLRGEGNMKIDLMKERWQA
jgi:hypothetical protein